MRISDPIEEQFAMLVRTPTGLHSPVGSNGWTLSITESEELAALLEKIYDELRRE